MPEPCFNRIRVACDLSKEDREQIRKLVQEGKKLNNGGRNTEMEGI